MYHNELDSFLITNLLTKTPSQAAFVNRMSYNIIYIYVYTHTQGQTEQTYKAATILHFVRMQRSSPTQRMYNAVNNRPA